MTTPAILPVTLTAVLDQYNIGRLIAPPQPGSGTANANLILCTTTGRYFLKRRNPKYAQQEAVAFDHHLMEYLAPYDLGTPLAVPNRAQKRWLEWDGFVFELYPYQEGEPHDPASLAQLQAAGERLAAFHAATRSFTGVGKTWPRYHDPARIREGVTALDSLLRERFCPDEYAYLQRQIQLLEHEYPDERYHTLPKQVVHGDYHPGNLKFRRDSVVGVFDLDWATRQPRLLDIADGVFLFAGIRKTEMDAGDIVSLTQTWIPDRARTHAFMNGYLTHETLTRAEWQALPLAIRARWLFCRVAGQAKLPPERRLDYFIHGLLEPLHALDAVQSELSGI